MKNQKYLKKISLMALVFLFAINNTLFCADSSDELKAFLIDIKGWTAEDLDGSYLNFGGMKMITATRNYNLDDKTLVVMILAGTNSMLQGQTTIPDIETSDAKVTTTKINDFNVIQTFNKKEDNGYILINLLKKNTEGSLLMFNYFGISSEEALKIAKEFDWKKVKAVTSKLLD